MYNICTSKRSNHMMLIPADSVASLSDSYREAAEVMTAPRSGTRRHQNGTARVPDSMGIHQPGLCGSLGKAEDHQTGQPRVPLNYTQSHSTDWKNGTRPSKMGLSHQKWDWASPSPILFVTPHVGMLGLLAISLAAVVRALLRRGMILSFRFWNGLIT